MMVKFNGVGRTLVAFVALGEHCTQNVINT